MEALKKIANFSMLVKTDLSVSPYLTEEMKEIFAKRYKETLYMPSQQERIGEAQYDGRTVDIFEAGSDFSMIVKRINMKEGNAEAIWNLLSKKGQCDKDDLRYYTSLSYMTGENLLYTTLQSEVILGFAERNGAICNRWYL